MKRRDALVKLFALGAAIRPFIAVAQNPAKIPSVGTLMFGSVATSGHLVDAFSLGLRERGYFEGTNIAIERRWADGNQDRLPALAAELVRKKVDVILAGSAVAAQIAKKASGSIPIVLAISLDPVTAGLAASLAHPGGNVTGHSQNILELLGKRFELLKELSPNAVRVAVFLPVAADGGAWLSEIERVAKSLQVETLAIEVTSNADFTRGFEVARKWRADSMLPLEGNQVFFARKLLAEFAIKNRLPAVYSSSAFAEAGGLISYGADYADLCRRAATYVDKILKGAKPGDLPIEQPTKFELAVNLRAAKAIGITFPQLILLRADRVIE